jgi:hypothetical protein
MGKNFIHGRKKMYVLHCADFLALAVQTLLRPHTQNFTKTIQTSLGQEAVP